MAFSINTLQSITQNYIAPKVVDNTFKGNPYTYWLKENARLSLRGGLALRFPIIKSQLNFDWYSGMDSATLEALEPNTAATFNWYQGRCPFVIPEEDIDKNSGPDGIVDLIDSTEQTATLTAMESLATALFGTNSSAPKQVDGLQDLFGASGTSYGGLLDTDFVSPATWITSIVTPLTANTLTALEMRRMRGSVTRGNSMPNLGLCNFSVYAKIWNLAQNNQRFGMPESSKIGFNHIFFENMAIMPDEHAPGSGFGSTDNWLMMLNTDYIKLVVHENKAFISRVYAPIPQIEAYIGKLLFMLAHVTTQRRAHAVIKVINPTL
jgi:hypothetical protein